MAHYIPCQGRLIALSFTLESSIKRPKERIAESTFYSLPGIEVPALPIGRRQSNDG
jgi:hypothetical protein